MNIADSLIQSQQASLTVPIGQNGIMISNQSTNSISIATTIWSMTIPPYCVLTQAVQPNLDITVTTTSGLVGVVEVVYTASSLPASLVPVQHLTTTTIFPSAQDVNITANNAGTLDVQFPTAQDVNLTANNAGTLDVQFPTAQDVNVTAGSVNATIQNASIDTNSTVLNKQIQQGMNYNCYYQFSVSASAGAASYTSPQITILPAGQSISSPIAQVWVYSPEGEYTSYSEVTVNLYQTFADGSTQTVQASAIDMFNISSTMRVFNLAGLFIGNPLMFNTVSITIDVGTSGIATADTPTVYILWHGQSDPTLTTDNYPGTQNIAFTLPGTTTPTGLNNAVPLPAQEYRWNAGGSTYDQVQQHKSFLAASNIAGGTTTTIDISIATIFKLSFSYGGDATGAMRIVANPGGQWLVNNVTNTSNDTVTVAWDFTDGVGYGVPGTTSLSIEQLFGASTDAVWYTLSISYV